MQIRLHNSCGINRGQSTVVVTDNIHTIGVVKPVYGCPTFQLTAKAV